MWPIHISPVRVSLSRLLNSPRQPGQNPSLPLTHKFLPLSIARRYLFAHKSQNAINIISAISALGVLVATAAIVIVLSVFNGLNGLVSTLFGTFDPDLRVEAAHGKAFEADSLLRDAIASCQGVACFSDVIEENALVRYGKRQVPVTVMGVGPTYNSVTNIDSITVEGCFAPDRCLLGDALAGQLSVSSVSFNPNIVLYAPKRVGKINMSRPETSFVERVERVGGIFAVQQAEYDATRILAPVDSVRLLFDYSQLDVTSFAIRVDSAASPTDVARELQSVLPDGLVVKDKWQQHESFFKMMEVEKLMAFAILLFIALIAAFNIIGSMSMLIFEKKESISVLRSIGADESLVTKVFLYEGWLLSVGGAVIGLLLGVALTLAQQRWGVVGFGGDDAYIIDAYPVVLQWTDVLWSAISVFVIGILATIYPIRVLRTQSHT